MKTFIIELLLFILIVITAIVVDHFNINRNNMTDKTAKNPITGDLIKTKAVSQKYYDNYDAIFRKNKESNNEKSTTSNTTTHSN